MSQPVHYRQVFSRVLQRYAGESPEALADRLIDALDLADVLMGDEPRLNQDARANLQPPIHPLIVPASTTRYPEINPEQALFIEPDAPPAAVVRNADKPPLQDTYEESQAKKQQIVFDVTAKLPPTITVKPKDLGYSMTLARYVRSSPEGTDFVRVMYGQDMSEEDAPQVNIYTHSPKVDPEAIMAEIIRQADMRYRKKVPVIVPRPAPVLGIPDIDAMVRSGQGPVATDPSPEERQHWDQNTAGLERARQQFIANRKL